VRDLVGNTVQKLTTVVSGVHARLHTIPLSVTLV